MNVHEPYRILSATNMVVEKDQRVLIEFTETKDQQYYIVVEILQVLQSWATDSAHYYLKLYDLKTGLFVYLTATHKHRND